MDNKRFSLGRYVVEIKWEEDDDADLSWLGRMTDNRSEWVVDRREGVLLGEWASFTVVVPAGELNLNADDFELERLWFSYDRPNNSAFEKAEAVLKPLVGAAHIYSEDGWDVEYDPYDETFFVIVEGYRIVREDLGHTMGWHEYRYFSLGDNHTPPGKNWQHVIGDELQKVIDQYGSIENADIHYALEDWKLYEEFQVYWWMMGCVVTIEDEDGLELGYGSLWGIESDCGYAHEREEEIYCLEQALKEADLTKVKAEKVWENYEAGRYEEVS